MPMKGIVPVSSKSPDPTQEQEMSKIEALKSEVARLYSAYRNAVRLERAAEMMADSMLRSGETEDACEKYWMEFVDHTACARAALVEAETQLLCAVNGWERSEIR